MEQLQVTHVLYIDVLFLINFVMDCLVLNTLRIILKGNTTWVRIGAAGSLGALWACIAAVWHVLPVFMEMMITWLAVSSLMIKITFPVHSMRELIKYLAGLYLATVTLAGAAYAFYQHTHFWIFYTACSYLLSIGLWHVFLEVRQRIRHLYPVTLTYGEKTRTFQALVDTGNHLYEPVSHRPVHILDYQACADFCGQVPGVVFIPFHSVGGQGMMPGIYLDSMVVEKNGTYTTVNKPLVAISRQPLSPGGEYQMLLNEAEVAAGE